MNVKAAFVVFLIEVATASQLKAATPFAVAIAYCSVIDLAYIGSNPLEINSCSKRAAFYFFTAAVTISFAAADF
nr:MAG TPA: hypothetical protein [Caudoviricetes sp.]